MKPNNNIKNPPIVNGIIQMQSLVSSDSIVSTDTTTSTNAVAVNMQDDNTDLQHNNYISKEDLDKVKNFLKTYTVLNGLLAITEFSNYYKFNFFSFDKKFEECNDSNTPTVMVAKSKKSLLGMMLDSVCEQYVSLSGTAIGALISVGLNVFKDSLKSKNVIKREYELNTNINNFSNSTAINFNDYNDNNTFDVAGAFAAIGSAAFGTFFLIRTAMEMYKKKSANTTCSNVATIETQTCKTLMVNDGRYLKKKGNGYEITTNLSGCGATAEPNSKIMDYIETYFNSCKEQYLNKKSSTFINVGTQTDKENLTNPSLLSTSFTKNNNNARSKHSIASKIEQQKDKSLQSF